jgi:hypothetical protein
LLAVEEGDRMPVYLCTGREEVAAAAAAAAAAVAVAQPLFQAEEELEAERHRVWLGYWQPYKIYPSGAPRLK